MTSPASRTSGYAWAVVAMLWPVAMLNYLDRQMLSTIRASIRADIPSIGSDQDFGTLMAVFMWVYALLSPIGGFIADRFNRRWTVIGSLFVWSGVTYLTGHANTYHEMLFYRALMGISEAFYIPAALALIADFHQGSTRARAIGVHQTGIYAGLALGGIGGYIAQMSTWRNCFTWFGGAGVLYAVVLAIGLKDASQPEGADTAKKPAVTIGDTLRALWSQPAFWILVIYFTLPAIAGWVTKNWLPTFLADRFQLKEGPAGLSATGYIQLASFVGVLLGGSLADLWMRTTSRGRILASAIGTMLLVPALLGLGYAWSLSAAVGFMILFGIGWGFFDCNNMPILCQIARPEHRATGYGFMNMVSISAGAGATVLLGWMRDHGIPFSIAFLISAAVALLSAILILFVKPRDPSELEPRS
ncbi:MAG: transporter, Spinster family, sphingosine-phosphate transporter [Chthoniobacter sp.]|nr:transporter, Spinster family, sphingosine-phosphate transporter [Chthoniobacter sp.]